MKVIQTIAALNEELAPYRTSGTSVGFVPTMGALHSGHGELVKQCVAENDVCVISIFVNPTQFNNKEDLRLYPRTLDADCKFIEELGATIVFTPSVEEMYPQEDTRIFDFGILDKVMEGRFRPGHFNGVAQIVSKLLYEVKPTKAYFGEKDFQQLAIVRRMVEQLTIPVQIIGVPIVREKSGLAMSSRNTLLSEEQREKASNIYKTLQESISLFNETTLDKVIDFVIDRINNIDGMSVEYFEIVDGNSLQLISDSNTSDFIVGCIAVFCGEVRLIDNITYKNN